MTEWPPWCATTIGTEISTAPAQPCVVWKLFSKNRYTRRFTLPQWVATALAAQADSAALCRAVYCLSACAVQNWARKNQKLLICAPGLQPSSLNASAASPARICGLVASTPMIPRICVNPFRLTPYVFCMTFLTKWHNPPSQTAENLDLKPIRQSRVQIPPFDNNARSE